MKSLKNFKKKKKKNYLLQANLINAEKFHKIKHQKIIYKLFSHSTVFNILKRQWIEVNNLSFG